MSKIDWYYIYSQRYYPFHFYLQEKIPSCFHAKGIFIDQSVFDEHLYKHEGEHFFSRITIKVETILRILQEKQEKGDATPFFFSDCDILVNPKSEQYLPSYTKVIDIDMYFQKEYNEQEIVNPGFMLIWPTQNSLVFWKAVLEDMKNDTSMEMTSINKLIHQIPVRASLFNTLHVCSCITIRHKDFCIYHILVKSSSRETDIGNKMFEAGLNGHVMDKYVAMTKEKYGRLYF